MAKQGRIYYTDRDFSDAEAGSEFGYPVILILTTDNKIVKITAYDELGSKSVALLDSANGNKIVSLGAITNDSSKIYLAVHSSGSNSVVINQNLYSKTTPDEFAYTTPTSGNVKVALIYALETTQIFYMIQGAEGETAIEPELPEGALLIRRIIITDGGASIDPSELDGFVEKQEESWKEINTGSGTNFFIDYSDARSRFKIKSSADVPKTINGINFIAETSRAVEFWVYNDTNLNINIPASATTGLQKGFANINAPFFILPKSKALLKYNPATNSIECWRDNSVGFSLPVVGNNGDILEKDNTVTGGAKWVDRFTGLTANFISFWNGSKFINSLISQVASKIGINNNSPAEMLDVTGRVKANSFVLANDIGTAIPNELGKKNGYLCHSDASGVLRYFSAAGLFKYTPTGNFTTSNLKTALEASGMFYHDAYVCIVIGSNNYTCNIDNGSSNLSRLLFLGKEGTTGSISFTSSRTLTAKDSITIMNGNEGSIVKITHGTSADILAIINS